jgi:hypothetical protein
MEDILIIYDKTFIKWYEEGLINSKLTIKKIYYNEQTIEELINVVNEYKNIVLLTENSFYKENRFPVGELLEKINITDKKNILQVILSNELNIYTFMDDSNKAKNPKKIIEYDYNLQKKYIQNYNLKILSCLINNQNVIFEPSIFPSSFIYLVGHVNELFNHNQKDFINSECRFGIMVNRKSKERFFLLKNLLKEPLHNKEFITLSNSKSYASQIPCFFDFDAMNTILKNSEENIKIRPYQINEVKGNKQYEDTMTIEYWKDGYNMFNKSKIEIVLETFNCNDYMEEWQYMFTEKTLKSLWAGKPLLYFDPMSFQLFEKWEFETDENLYGKDLVELFRNFDKKDIKITEKWLVPFVNRLKEIDKMSNDTFNEMYQDSVLLSQKNREKITKFDWWYNDIEKWFNIDYNKKTKKLL